MDEQIFQTILAFFLIIYVLRTSCSYFEVTLSLPVQYFSTGNQNAIVAAVCELEPLGTLLTVVLGACRGLQLVTAYFGWAEPDLVLERRRPNISSDRNRIEGEV